MRSRSGCSRRCRSSGSSGSATPRCTGPPALLLSGRRRDALERSIGRIEHVELETEDGLLRAVRRRLPVRAHRRLSPSPAAAVAPRQVRRTARCPRPRRSSSSARTSTPAASSGATAPDRDDRRRRARGPRPAADDGEGLLPCRRRSSDTREFAAGRVKHVMAAVLEGVTGGPDADLARDLRPLDGGAPDRRRRRVPGPQRRRVLAGRRRPPRGDGLAGRGSSGRCRACRCRSTRRTRRSWRSGSTSSTRLGRRRARRCSTRPRPTGRRAGHGRPRRARRSSCRRPARRCRPARRSGWSGRSR